MITEAVIVALIAGACSVIGNWLISRSNRAKDEIERAKRDAVTDERLDRIESKLDEHNGYAKKFEVISIAIAEMRTELKLRNELHEVKIGGTE